MAFMTPIEVLEMTEHDRCIISPSDYSDFESLRRARKLIRDLRLVPKRTYEVQSEYERMPRSLYLAIIRDHYVNGSPISLVNEMYPSDLPPDIEQKVVWIRDDDIPNYSVAEFITRAMLVAGLTAQDIILFERSRKTNTDFVKVAVPEFRHIHLWMKAKTL